MDLKICPICNQPKELNEFLSYFDKSRNKERLSGYCNPCRKKKSRERALKHYKDNIECKKQYAKEYRKNPEKKDNIKRLSQKFKKKYAAELHDVYIRDRLSSDNNIPIYISKELPEILETKRLEIKLKRKIKELKNGKK
jgi:hypothetical protein